MLTFQPLPTTNSLIITVNPDLFPIPQGREALLPPYLPPLPPHPTLTLTPNPNPTPGCCLTANFPAMWERTCSSGCSLEDCVLFVFKFFLMEQFTSQLKVHNSACGWWLRLCFYHSYICVHVDILMHKYKCLCVMGHGGGVGWGAVLLQGA